MKNEADVVEGQPIAHGIIRSRPGASVVHRTLYFFVTNNPLEPDIVCRAYKRFLTPDCLGSGLIGFGNKLLSEEKQPSQIYVR